MPDSEFTNLSREQQAALEEFRDIAASVGYELE
jgi:hypothetical protein